MWHKTKTIAAIILMAVFSSSLHAQQVMRLAEGEASNINLTRNIATVFIANPEIADYQVIDKQKIVIFGKEIGETNIIIFDEQSDILQSYKLIVNKSLSYIQDQIQLHYPDAEVMVSNIGEQVVLTGTVATEQEKDEINILTGELLSKEVDKFDFEWTNDEEDLEMQFMQRRQFTGVVNNIKVATTKQVNVKLSIAEVSHSFLEEIGVDYGSVGTSAGTFVNQLTHFSASDIIAVISAVGDDTVGQILAEPNLSVISGESASFLVGGELPLVTYVDDTATVTYKEFGIRLDLMAKVLRDDKIVLSLIPEVSALDSTYENDEFNLPALKTSRARTTVELGDGQSFVLAGLLSSEERESISKIPFLGDIPYLGALFSHSATERNKSELIIVATVNLVKPIHPSQVQLPVLNRTTTLQRWFSQNSQYKQGTSTSPYQKKTEQRVDDVLANGGFKK